MQNLNINFYNLLIFVGIIHGFIFSFIVLINKKYKSITNKYIAFTILSLSISILQYWFIDVNINGFASIFKTLRIPCDTLIVPFFYLYVNHYLQNKVSKNLIILLISPFIIQLIINLYLYYSSLSYYNFKTLNISMEVISSNINLLLIVLIFYQLKKHEHENSNYNITKVKIETKWLKQILYIGLTICVFWIIEILYVQIVFRTIGFKIFYPLWISISILIYWISYVGIYQSKILNERKTIRKSIIKINVENKISKNKKTNTKLFNEINNWIVNDKIYLNPNLKLDIISEKFNISTGYLSQLINNHSDYNFNDFINLHRINEAKIMLTNPDFDKYTIQSIAYEAGFNSKSSFYSAFKKKENITPNEYKKLVLNH